MDKIALIVQPSNTFAFQVRKMDEFGGQEVVAQAMDLESALREAAQRLNHPLVIPISGPNTAF